MNKDTFLLQLGQLLYDIPNEERQEALEYYESYFQDAGEENEAHVLKELGSPQKIAESIKEGLKDGGPTESVEHPLQVRTNKRSDSAQTDAYNYEKQRANAQNDTYDYEKQRANAQSDTYDYEKQRANAQSDTYDYEKQRTNTHSDTYDYGRRSGNYRRYYEKDPRSESSYGNGSSYRDRASYGNKQNYGQYGQPGKPVKQSGADKSAKWILLLLAVIMTAPLWGSLASVLLSLCGITIAAVVVLGIFAVGGVIGGLVCTVIGIVRLCMMSLIQGLILLGVGMLLIAAGGISIILLVLLCAKLLPWAVNLVSSLLHKVWDWCLNLRHV